jgi:hypothetical protein
MSDHCLIKVPLLAVTLRRGGDVTELMYCGREIFCGINPLKILF